MSPEDFIARVVTLGLAEPMQIDHARAEMGLREVTTQELIQALVRSEILTNLQVEKILKGDRIGFFYSRYKVLYLVGSGTFARVYRCVNRETGDVVALKVLRKRYRDDMNSLEQFLREGRMGLRLRHPSIVSVYEVDPDVHHPFMAMEFVEGQTLRQLVQIRGGLPPDISLKLIHDVTSGLAYAYSQGVTHRDLKMSNCLVTSTQRAKLVDFGLAAISDPKNDAAVADCPNARAIDYAALERGTGVRNGDPRSDIYFAGVMFYHMLAGKSPLTEALDRAQRLNVSRLQQIPHIQSHLPELPNYISMIVSRMTEFDPEKRYQSSAEVQADVRNAIDRYERGETTNKREAEVASSRVVSPEIEGQGRTIMVIESRMDLQEVFRDRLKSKGYRVLLFSDPSRALARFVPGDPPPADCVIFSAPDLATSALQAFNRFAMDEHTRDIPAILLVDPQQEFIIRQAKFAAHRLKLLMPLKVREMRIALLKLLANRPQAESMA